MKTKQFLSATLAIVALMASCKKVDYRKLPSTEGIQFTSKIEGNAIINFIEKELKGSVNINAYTTVEVVSSSGEAIASLTKNGSTINKVVNKG